MRDVSSKKKMKWLTIIANNQVKIRDIKGVNKGKVYLLNTSFSMLTMNLAGQYWAMNGWMMTIMMLFLLLCWLKKGRLAMHKTDQEKSTWPRNSSHNQSSSRLQPHRGSQYFHNPSSISVELPICFIIQTTSWMNILLAVIGGLHRRFLEDRRKTRRTIPPFACLK